jgi:hypothetical protein
MSKFNGLADELAINCICQLAYNHSSLYSNKLLLSCRTIYLYLIRVFGPTFYLSFSHAASSKHAHRRRFL